LKLTDLKPFFLILFVVYWKAKEVSLVALVIGVRRCMLLLRIWFPAIPYFTLLVVVAFCFCY